MGSSRFGRVVLLLRSGAPSMSSTGALAVVLQPWWPQPLARVPLALRDLVALSCCSRALRDDGLDRLHVLQKMFDKWSEAVLGMMTQEFEQWLREDTERFLARWRSWNRELEKAEAEEQAELEKQRAIMEFDPAHLD